MLIQYSLEPKIYLKSVQWSAVERELFGQLLNLFTSEVKSSLIYVPLFHVSTMLLVVVFSMLYCLEDLWQTVLD